MEERKSWNSEEGLRKLREHSVPQKREWFFGLFTSGNDEVYFYPTRILEPFERSTNLPLPESFSIMSSEMPKQHVVINVEGIKTPYNSSRWDQIQASGIKQVDNSSREGIVENFVVLLLETGRIVEAGIVVKSNADSQFGDLIEQYKREFYKSKMSGDR